MSELLSQDAIQRLDQKQVLQFMQELICQRVHISPKKSRGYLPSVAKVCWRETSFLSCIEAATGSVQIKRLQKGQAWLKSQVERDSTADEEVTTPSPRTTRPQRQLSL